MSNKNLILKNCKRFLNLQTHEPIQSNINNSSLTSSFLLKRDNFNNNNNNNIISDLYNKDVGHESILLDPSKSDQKLLNPFDLSKNYSQNLSSHTSTLNPEVNFPHLKMNIPKDLSTHLQSIVSQFDNLSTCFGYGSGVFPQATKTQTKNQIDLLMSVENPIEWHKQNIKKHPQHYSTMKYFINIPSVFEKIQGFGAGVYFNPFTQIHGSEVKYGVMGNNTLIKDLSSWDTFYIAGRLQKPVMNLTPYYQRDEYNCFDLEVGYWLQRNLIAAVVLAKNRSVSKYGTKFTDFQFFTELCTLSYLGDIRFKLGGENPAKCANIVNKNLDNFKLLYGNILNEVMLMEDSIAEKYLPSGFTLENYEKQLEKIIAEKSLEQAVKGVFTAGIWKSCKYAWAKKMKALKK